MAGTSSVAVDIVPSNDEESNIPQVAGDVALDTDLRGMTLGEDRPSTDNDVVMKSSEVDVDTKDMPGLTKEQVDKSGTSGLPERTSQAPSTIARHRNPSSFVGIKNIKETSLLHLRNRILSGDYFRLCSPPVFALKHKSQEVKTLYDISLHSACAATYQRCVDRGSFDIPDPWLCFNALWEEDTPCNKLPNTLIEYLDGSYLKCHYSRPVIVGVRFGPNTKVDELMLTTQYDTYPENESWCKTIEKWIDKKPEFVIYSVMSPT